MKEITCSYYRKKCCYLNFRSFRDNKQSFKFFRIEPDCKEMWYKRMYQIFTCMVCCLPKTNLYYISILCCWVRISQ